MEMGEIFVLQNIMFYMWKGSKTAQKQGGGWKQPFWSMPVFIVFISLNGFPDSLTERMCSSKNVLYNHNN